MFWDTLSSQTVLVRQTKVIFQEPAKILHSSLKCQSQPSVPLPTPTADARAFVFFESPTPTPEQKQLGYCSGPTLLCMDSSQVSPTTHRIH